MDIISPLNTLASLGKVGTLYHTSTKAGTSYLRRL